MSTNPTIRMACLADLPDVTSLRQQWSASHGFVGDSGEFTERVRGWWESQGDSRVRWGYIGNVWVDPEHRGRGVATALMTAAIEWCRAQSFERIVLNSSDMSARMYRRLGFRPADELLRLDL